MTTVPRESFEKFPAFSDTGQNSSGMPSALPPHGAVTGVRDVRQPRMKP
jgi:hypothetical protein